MLRLLSQLLLLLLVARVGAVPLTRRFGSADALHPARVLLRFCPTSDGQTLAVAAARTAGGDDDLAWPSPPAARAESTGPGAGPDGAAPRPSPPPFLSRPPSRLLC